MAAEVKNVTHALDCCIDDSNAVTKTNYMNQTLTIRVPETLLGKAEACAARLGLRRTAYVRRLIERDVARAASAPKSKFASEDLIGIHEGNGKAATNATVRTMMQRKRR